MKVLIYGINYHPEVTGIGKYTGEMATWLAARGHDVRVVTAPPYYPQWQVADGYAATRYRLEQRDGVAVYRCPLWVPGRVSGLKRLVHLASFAASSLPAMIRQAFWRPDVVWMAAPALFCAPGALLAAKLGGAKSWLHVQDYEVDAAFELGLLKQPATRRFALAVERGLLRAFDRVSSISGRMLALACQKGVAASQVVSFPNWVVLPAASLAAEAAAYRQALGIAPDTVVALYSGNMGAKQGLETLAESARQFAAQGSRQLLFVFCGQGTGRAALEQACHGLPNVRFLDLQPVEKLPAFLQMADLHLLPQKAGAADLVMPSKLTGMLASGRPVVACAAPGTELADVVAGKGVVIAPESVPDMVAAISQLAADSPLRQQYGQAGRRYAEQFLDQDAIMAAFEKQLQQLCGQP